MEFAVRILRVESVSDVPNSDRLSVVKVLGYESVVAKNEDGSHRYAPGDRVLYVPEAAVIPEEQLKANGLWGFNKVLGKVTGLLAGPLGNRVRIVELRRQLSTGLVWTLPDDMADLPDLADVTERLGIVKYEPVLDEQLLAMARTFKPAKLRYDIVRLKTYPNLLVGKEVVITEKLEGECQIAIWMGGEVHDELFDGGRISISSKGLARAGMCFRDVPEARREPVVRAAFNNDLFGKMRRLAAVLGETRQIMLVSEAIGGGVKKLHYDHKEPSSRGIDIRVDGRWLPEDEKAAAMEAAGIERVPVLWRGKFDPAEIEVFREGNTTIGGKHIREGFVATYVGEQDEIETELGDWARPCVKAHCDIFQRKLGHDHDDAE